jgi:DNA invertase Pin-like site-specific DNA recombinase
MSKNTAYGYIRVSTETQNEKGYGLETQRTEILKYCKNNELELLDMFEDKGISGTEAVESEGDELISRRKGLIKLLSVINGTNNIIVLNTSRLWRSDIAKVLIRREIERKGGEVISIEQPRYSIYKFELPQKSTTKKRHLTVKDIRRLRVSCNSVFQT